MEFMELMKERRSVRAYADKPVDQALVNEVIRAAQLAPSWKNSQTGRPFQQLFLVGGPTPAVGEQMGNHGRHFADVHHHGRDMLHMVLLRHCFDVLDDIEYDSEFVHF